MIRTGCSASFIEVHLNATNLASKVHYQDFTNLISRIRIARAGRLQQEAKKSERDKTALGRISAFWRLPEFGTGRILLGE